MPCYTEWDLVFACNANLTDSDMVLTRCAKTQDRSDKFNEVIAVLDSYSRYILNVKLSDPFEKVDSSLRLKTYVSTEFSFQSFAKDSCKNGHCLENLAEIFQTTYGDGVRAG